MRRLSIWRLFGLAALALALAAFAALAVLVLNADVPNVHITVDGAREGLHLDLASMPPAHKVMLVLGVVFAVVAALLVVPVALLILGLVFAVALVAGIGLPLLALVALATVLLSPLIVIVLLVAWMLRRGRREATTIAA